MSIRELRAIDVHGHYGRCDRPGQELITQLRSADAATVAARAKAANTEYIAVSPLRGLMPRGNSDAVAGNMEAARLVAEHKELLQWVIIDPRKPETYEQADWMLRTPKCVGIKIHPEEHLYHIREFADAIFSFAAERNAVVLTHSGENNSMPEDFIPFADAHPQVKLILAHIGNGYDGDMGHQVRAIQRSRACNVFADTSSACSITPNLIEWAVREVGAERVLFGTDTPLYCAAMQRLRIDAADLSDSQKSCILRDNAFDLLQLRRLSTSAEFPNQEHASRRIKMIELPAHG